MKIIINLCLLFCLCFALAACTEIYFTEPQPRGKKALDNGFQELVGEYFSVDDSGNKDTFRVTKDEIIFPDEESMDEGLSNIFVVKKYRGCYFLNFYDGDKDLWSLIVVDPFSADSLYVTNFIALEEEPAEELLKMKYAEKVVPEGEDDYILLDPSRRKLMKLIKDPLFEENRTYLRKIKD